MKNAWVTLSLFALLTVGALAQQQVQTIPGDGGPLRFDSSGFAIFGTGHLSSTGPAPILSACGGAGLALTGSDHAGTVTVGGTATTACTITFARAYPVAPTCLVSWASGPLAAMSYTVSTTAITVAQTSTASNTLTYICFGKQ